MLKIYIFVGFFHMALISYFIQPCPLQYVGPTNCIYWTDIVKHCLKYISLMLINQHCKALILCMPLFYSFPSSALIITLRLVSYTVSISLAFLTLHKNVFLLDCCAWFSYLILSSHLHYRHTSLQHMIAINSNVPIQTFMLR